jgi:hypothetical protein
MKKKLGRKENSMLFLLNHQKLSHKMKKKHINNMTIKQPTIGLTPSIKIVLHK